MTVLSVGVLPRLGLGPGAIGQQTSALTAQAFNDRWRNTWRLFHIPRNTHFSNQTSVRSSYFKHVSDVYLIKYIFTRYNVSHIVDVLWNRYVRKKLSYIWSIKQGSFRDLKYETGGYREGSTPHNSQWGCAPGPRMLLGLRTLAWTG